jgi:hypothetical protein
MLSMPDVWMGLSKPSVLGFVIVIVGCHNGLQTSGGTRGVGKATTGGRLGIGRRNWDGFLPDTIHDFVEVEQQRQRCR